MIESSKQIEEYIQKNKSNLSKETIKLIRDMNKNIIKINNRLNTLEDKMNDLVKDPLIYD